MATSTIARPLELKSIYKIYGNVTLNNSGYNDLGAITDFNYNQLVSCEIHTWTSATGAFTVTVIYDNHVYVIGTPNISIVGLQIRFIYANRSIA